MRKQFLVWIVVSAVASVGSAFAMDFNAPSLTFSPDIINTELMYEPVTTTTTPTATAVSASSCGPGYVYRVRPSGNHVRNSSTGGTCVQLGCNSTVDSSGKVACVVAPRPLPTIKISEPIYKF